MAVSTKIDVDPKSEEVLLTFYRRLYPFKSLYTWLNHETTPQRLFTHREFTYTLQGDVYLRYNSYGTVEDLKKDICSKVPLRFEIGPVYSAKPRDRKTVRAGKFKADQRELVFDVDLTDYDPVRTCCSGAAICRRCWPFIVAAVQVLDNALRDQFGYQHLLWVYSGRRGIHLWISDKEAMELTDDQRKAMVNWLTVVLGGKEPGKKVNARVGSKPLPPPIKAALEDLARIFTSLILEDQDCFASPEGSETLLSLIPDPKVVKNLREKWAEYTDRSSSEKWDDLKDQARSTPKGSAERLRLSNAMEDIILQYTYPRLDAEVSKHRNHLLKAPFCIHPSTGRICVPVDPSRIEEFDPETVPTIGQLLMELDEAGASHGGGEHHSDWEKTSLKPYVDIFDEHVKRLTAEVRKAKQEMDTSW